MLKFGLLRFKISLYYWIIYIILSLWTCLRYTDDQQHS